METSREALTVGDATVYAVAQVTSGSVLQSETALAVTDLGPPVKGGGQKPPPDPPDCPQFPRHRRIVLVANSFTEALNMPSGGPFITAHFSDDLGKSWTPSAGVSNPSAQGSPGGYKLQWVDPAAVSCPDLNNRQRVFIGSLATSATAAQFGGVNPPAIAKGACIHRSDDGGATFTLDGCVPPMAPVSGTGYDGASFACDAAGRLYAAFRNLDTDGVEVWLRNPGAPNYTKLPNPGYAKGTSMETKAIGHPRLAATGGGAPGVYLSVATNPGDAAIDVEGRLQLAFLPLGGNAWVPALGQRPTSTKPVHSCPGPPAMAPPFSVHPDQALDVGAPTDLGVTQSNNDAVRAVYGADYFAAGKCPSIGPVVLRTLHCDLNLTLATCEDTERWGTNPNPGMDPPSKTFHFSPNVQQDVSLLPFHGWVVTWLSSAPSGAVENHAAQMGVVGGVRTLTHEERLCLTSPPPPGPLQKSMCKNPEQAACRDMSNAQFYWGHYDDMKVIGAGCGETRVARGIFPMYIKGFTDSRLGGALCSSLEQHAGSLTFFK